MSEKKKAIFLNELNQTFPSKLTREIKSFKTYHSQQSEMELATRKASEICLDLINECFENTIGGSADLTGSNNTKEAIDYSKHAESVGANAALVVTPYYNKPTQDGLYAHFESIAQSVKIPIIIYNIPGRSVVDMSIETMIKLSKIDNIVGVKDATNDLFRPLLTAANMHRDFCFLSGEDGTALAFLSQGGHGCISVTANVAPALCSQLQDAWRKKDIDKAQEINLKLAKLHHSLFLESSPGPVKFAASLIGLCSSETRLPLVEISDSTKASVSNCLKELSLI